MYKILKLLAFLPVLLLMPTIVKGKKNLDKKGKVILAFNHLTYLDVVLLGVYLNRRIYFIGKKELQKSKFINWIFKVLNVIPVDRDKVEMSTVKSVFNVLKNDGAIGIFPEGTRNKTKEIMLPFKDGVTIFAERTGAPVVPIIIKRKPLLFVPNKIIIGEKLYFKSDNDNNNNTEILRNKMIEMRLKELNKNGKDNTRDD